ncbi:MAG: hypothetical protein ACK5XA_08580 [Tagaea sp.]
MDGRDALYELHHAEQLKLQQLEEESGGRWPSTHPHRNQTMPKLSEMMPSKYLKKEDLDEYDGELAVTIVKIKQENVAKENDPEEWKWLAKFKELDKPLILNSTNLQLMAKALLSDESDDWIGQRLTLYVDPNIQFGGKIVGGLRVKAMPKKKARPVEDDDEPAPRPRQRDPGDDDEPAPRR